MGARLLRLIVPHLVPEKLVRIPLVFSRFEKMVVARLTTDTQGTIQTICPTPRVVVRLSVKVREVKAPLLLAGMARAQSFRGLRVFPLR